MAENKAIFLKDSFNIHGIAIHVRYLNRTLCTAQSLHSTTILCIDCKDTHSLWSLSQILLLLWFHFTSKHMGVSFTKMFANISSDAFLNWTENEWTKWYDQSKVSPLFRNIPSIAKILKFTREKGRTTRYSKSSVSNRNLREKKTKETKTFQVEMRQTFNYSYPSLTINHYLSPIKKPKGKFAKAKKVKHFFANIHVQCLLVCKFW